ncbi:hypothetical protein VH6_08290 [Helicobacter pylori]
MSRFDREKPIDIIWLHNGENSICYQIYQAVYNKNKKYTLMLFARSNEYLNLKGYYLLKTPKARQIL